jgi:hypothetical protein
MVNSYPLTPRFTPHARERVHEMKLTTKYVKSEWRKDGVDYPGPPIHGKENRIRKPKGSDVAIAWMDKGEGPVILTVLWQGDKFTREDNREIEKAIEEA